MLQTLNSSKTAEIMARYRPIAPKPADQQIPVKPTNGENSSSSSMNQKMMESPYLRSVWPHLQARPTRTRRRGRTSVGPTVFKRLRPSNYVQPFSPYDQVTNSPAKNLSMHAFAHPPNGPPQFLPVPNFTTLNAAFENPPAASPATQVTLPVAIHPPETPEKPVQKDLDLNKAADAPEEKDLLQKLLVPTTTVTKTTSVITPQPIRSVDSSISVESISKEPGSDLVVQGPIKAEEIEEEMESEALPVIISDSNNKVRLANSAYKELVGQPECSWLDSMVSCGGVCKRVCGEVKLQLPDSGHKPISSNGFFCSVRIEWGNNGKKSTIRTSCDAIRLYCESRDYLFAWRFHTKGPADSASNA